MAEEARLESVYTSKAYPGFESPSLRKELTGFKAIKAECLFESPSLRKELTGFKAIKAESLCESPSLRFQM